MNRKKERVYIMAVLGIITVFFIVKGTLKLTKAGVLKEVYARNNFAMLQINFKASNVINNEFMNFEDMQSLIDKVLKELNIAGKVEKEDEESDFIRRRVVTRNAKNSQTIITIQSQKGDIIETRLSINIVIYNGECDKESIQNTINKIYKELNKESNLNITMVGTAKGRLDKESTINMARNIMTSLRGKIISEYETEILYSLYGYTNMLGKEVIVTNEKEANIHLAIRYNEYEDVTYLYLASPIITYDY